MTGRGKNISGFGNTDNHSIKHCRSDRFTIYLFILLTIFDDNKKY